MNSEGIVVKDDLSGQFDSQVAVAVGTPGLLPVEGTASCSHTVLWAGGTKLLGHSD